MVIEAKCVVGSARGIGYQQDDKDAGASVEICRNFIMSDTPAEIHAEMRIMEKRYKRSNLKNPRIEIVIAPTPEESRGFREEDWEELALRCLEKVGIRHEDHAYIAHLHTSTGKDHLHLKISRISAFGEMRVSSEDIGRRFGAAADAVAMERGWKTARETKAAKLAGIGELVGRNFERSGSLAEFIRNMAEDGLVVQTSEKEGKVYGMRVIPASEYKAFPSKKLELAGQGYKFSEIPTGEGKAKYKTADFVRKLEEREAPGLAASAGSPRVIAGGHGDKDRPATLTPPQAAMLRRIGESRNAAVSEIVQRRKAGIRVRTGDLDGIITRALSATWPLEDPFAVMDRYAAVFPGRDFPAEIVAELEDINLAYPAAPTVEDAAQFIETKGIDAHSPEGAKRLHRELILPAAPYASPMYTWKLAGKAVKITDVKKGAAPDVRRKGRYKKPYMSPGRQTLSRYISEARRVIFPLLLKRRGKSGEPLGYADSDDMVRKVLSVLRPGTDPWQTLHEYSETHPGEDFEKELQACISEINPLYAEEPTPERVARFIEISGIRGAGASSPVWDAPAVRDFLRERMPDAPYAARRQILDKAVGVLKVRGTTGKELLRYIGEAREAVSSELVRLRKEGSSISLQELDAVIRRVLPDVRPGEDPDAALAEYRQEFPGCDFHAEMTRELADISLAYPVLPTPEEAAEYIGTHGVDARSAEGVARLHQEFVIPAAPYATPAYTRHLAAQAAGINDAKRKHQQPAAAAPPYAAPEAEVLFRYISQARRAIVPLLAKRRKNKDAPLDFHDILDMLARVMPAIRPGVTPWQTLNDHAERCGGRHFFSELVAVVGRINGVYGAELTPETVAKFIGILEKATGEAYSPTWDGLIAADLILVKKPDATPGEVRHLLDAAAALVEGHMIPDVETSLIPVQESEEGDNEPEEEEEELDRDQGTEEEQEQNSGLMIRRRRM